MCITIAANIAETAILTYPACFPDSVVGFIADPQKCDVRFIEYLFRYKKRMIQHEATGSVQDNINLETLDRMTFSIPSLTEQKAIAGVLSALDEKIELNRKTNQMLEGMARALFKEWFVDFGPVRAKAAARRAHPKWSDDQINRAALPDLESETAGFFSDSFIDVRDITIPKGWRIGTIAELCNEITSGGTPSRRNSDYWEGGQISWFKTGELHDDPLLDSEEYITTNGLKHSSCELWPEGTILFALYASPTVGRMGVLTTPGTANQAAAALLVREEYGNGFLFETLRHIRNEVQNIAVGAAQQNINQKILKEQRCVIPPLALAARYSALFKPLFDRRVQIKRESKLLAAIRDALLPKLISGELRVKDAERVARRGGV